MADLFKLIKDGEEETKKMYTVLFDISGSTMSDFNSETKTLNVMIDKFFERLKAEKVHSFRCLFFGSSTMKMPLGFVIEYVPFVVNIGQDGFLHRAREIYDICNLTCPHLAIDAIPCKFVNGPNSELLVVTDGELFDGNSNKNGVKLAFAESMNNFLKKYPRCTCSILAIDAGRAVTENAVGCDMYQAIQSRGLTKQISSFCLVTRANSSGSFLFSNMRCAPGFVAYDEERMFSKHSEALFFAWVREQILTVYDDSAYDIVRKVATTVCSLIQDEGMSPFATKSIIRSYSSLFKLFASRATDLTADDLIDCFQQQVQNILTGHAELSAAYTTDRKRRMKYAQQCLGVHVKDAIGCVSDFGFSLPLCSAEGRADVYEIPMAEASHCFMLHYPHSSYTDKNGTCIPVFPNARRQSEATDQCTRQYIRAVCAKWYGFNVQSETTRFAFLIQMLSVFLSDGIPQRVIDGYLALGLTLLKKTQPGSPKTDLERLVAGDMLPMTDKKNWSSHLSEALAVIYKRSDLDAGLVWFGICKALSTIQEDDRLAVNQFEHCQTAVGLTKDNYRSILLSYPRVGFVHVDPQSPWTFECPITREDTSSGGFAYPEHAWAGGKTSCNRREVLSAATVEDMKVSGNATCVFCRFQMPVSSLMPVEKAQVSQILFPEEYSSGKKESITHSPTKERRLVVSLFGTVGSGKSKVAKLMSDHFLRLGVRCLVAGTDHHCVELLAAGEKKKHVTKKAIDLVKEEVLVFLQSSEPGVIVVDTCGDVYSEGYVFGVQCPGFACCRFYPNLYDQEKMTAVEWDNYLAWSLMNVLARSGNPQSSDGYWLNPHTAGHSTCIDVHARKAKSLFQKEIFIPSKSGKLAEIKLKLKDRATAYSEFLRQHTLETDVCSFLCLKYF
jgi:hypothetical protein